MSEKKLTPAEAWELVNPLWPDVTHIAKEGSSFGLRIGKAWGQSPEGLVAIDWPSDVDRWPPIEKPRRPARMPEDYGKKAWFRNGSDGNWVEGVLFGYCPLWSFAWCAEDGKGWDQCEVECDEPKPAKVVCDDPVPSANEPEPEWITPTEEHIGQIVEVRDYSWARWYKSQGPKLISIDHSLDAPFEIEQSRWKCARIRNPKYKG